MRTNKIWLGDNLTIMPNFPDDLVRLTVTSPPYDDLRSFEGAPPFNEPRWRQLIKELYRVTGKGGICAWVVHDRARNGMTGTSLRQALAFIDSGWRWHDHIVLDKQLHVGGRNRYGPPEVVYVFSKGRPEYVNIIRDKPNKTAGKLSIYNHRLPNGKQEFTRWVQTSDWGCRGPVWKVVRGGGHTAKESYAFEHPALMNETLAEDLIISFSRPGELVFDPFMGAGTTAKMALLNRRQYLGIEVMPTYYDISRRRLEETRHEMRAKKYKSLS